MVIIRNKQPFFSTLCKIIYDILTAHDMAEHNALGAWGEKIAAEYLMEKGYTILFRDWKYQHRDLDIIATEGDVLVIVEVKTRRNELFTDADLAVDAGKVRSISIAANAFIKRHPTGCDVRFDIITIVGTPQTGHIIRHIEDAFLPFI